MSEWKPCPFCGSTALRIDKCTKRVKCQKCYATGGFITPFVNQGMTEDEAMKATWNRRYREGDGTDGIAQQSLYGQTGICGL